MTFDAMTLPLDGRQLIEASAGTGKTHTLTTLVLRHVIERDVPIEQILLVTFTRAATAEMSVRIRERLESVLRTARDGAEPVDDAVAALVAADPRRARERAARALASMDRACVWTIHGFCQRLLARWPIETGWLDADAGTGDEAAAVREAVTDAWVARAQGLPPVLERLARARTVRVLQDIAPVVLDGRLQTAPSVSPADLAALGSRARETDRWVRAVRRQLGPDAVCLRDVLPDPNDRSAFGLGKHVDTLLRAFQAGWPASALIHIVLQFAQTDDAPVVVALRSLAAELADLETSLSTWAAGVRSEVLHGAVERLLVARQEGAVVPFDELVRRARQAVATPALAAEVRRAWPVLLVDEFQDTDASQWDLLRTVWDERAPAALIGDPKQAIYGFRNADVFTYLWASRTAVERHSIGVNYRSDPGVVAAVNALFDPPRLGGRAFVVADIHPSTTVAVPGRTDALVDADGAPLPAFEWWTDFDLHGGHPELKHLPARVSTEIVALLSGNARLETREGRRPLRPSDIAVLVRSNELAHDYALALRQRGVPARTQSRRDVVVQPVARDAVLWLRAMARPEDGSAVRNALLTPLFERSAQDLVALARDEAAWQEVVERFRAAETMFRANGPLAAGHHMFASDGIAARLAARPDGDRDLIDLHHLLELLQMRWASSPTTPAALAANFAAEVDAGARNSQDDAVLARAGGDSHGVAVVTIHSAKGLQYPVVVLPDLLKGEAPKAGVGTRFHRDGAATAWLSEVVPDDVRHLAEDEKLAEDVRLAYVAVTRARHAVRAVAARLANVRNAAIPWLALGNAGMEPIAATMATAASGNGWAGRFRVAFSSPPWAGHVSRPLGPASDARWPAPEPPAVPPRPPAWPEVSRSWRVGSFSSLTAHGDDERDLDASALAQAPAEGGDVRLADLPAGVAVGTALHGVLERIDFQDPVDLREQVAEAFADGSAPPEWIDEVVAALRDVLRTPLGPDGHRLCDIAASRRLVEMPFTLAIRADGFDPAALADVFARHGRTEMAQDLRGLGFPLIEGFLRGVVDLIYAHEGRFYVADHKSNHLGPRVADYGRARMDAAMRQHHYGLQAALYTVALHRHLRHRLRDYDPARHLGGIRYLFLRGMHPDHPPGTGVFIDRLPDALVADLDGLFHVRPR